MEIYQIQPFTGEGIETILELVRSESRGPEFHAAWQKIEKDVHHFLDSDSDLDFNEICLDIITLEALAYPILLENAKRPLKSSEMKDILEQIQSTLEQLKSLKSDLKQLNQQNSDLTEQLVPLFEKLKAIYQEMRHQWDQYNKAREEFQVEEHTEGEPEQEKVKTIPHFNHVGWQVLHLCFNSLWAEVEYRTKWQNGVGVAEEIVHYPLFPILIGEIQTIYAHTQGFELLERAQLAQKRIQQLAHKLQFLYGPEPILPEKKKSVRDSTDSTKEQPVKRTLPGFKKENKKIWMWFSIFGLGIIGLVLLTLISQPPSDKKKSKSFQSQFSSPKSVTRKQTSSLLSERSEEPKKSVGNVRQIVQSKRLKIPVYAPNESMKKLFEAQEVTTEMLRGIIKQTKELTALIVDEEEAYFVSEENFLYFDSVEKLKNFIDEIAVQYEQVVQVAEVLQNEFAQYQISVSLPEANGPLDYGLVVRDKNGRMVGQIGMSADVLELQWKDVKDNLIIKNAQDLVKAIRAVETSQ